MFTLFKFHWPSIRSFLGNFYFVVVLTIAVFFGIFVLMPPLINSDFLSMALGIFLIIVMCTIEVISVSLWLEHMTEPK